MLARLQRVVRRRRQQLWPRHRLGAAPSALDDGLAAAALRRHRLLQIVGRGSSFLPQADAGFLAVEVRAPASSSLDYAKLSSTPLLRWPHRCRRPGHVGPPQCQRRAGLCGHWRTARPASAPRPRWPATCASAWPPGRCLSTSCSTISTNGAQKPIQIRFMAPTRKLQELTQAFVKTHAGHQGRGGCGLFRAGPAERAADRNGPRLANQLGISVQRCRQALRVAFAGVEVDDWRTPPAKRVTWPCACTRLTGWTPPTSSACRLPLSGTNRVSCRWIRSPPSPWQGPGQIQHADGKRTITVMLMPKAASPGEITAEAQKLAKSIDFPLRLRHRAGWPWRGISR